MYSLHSIDKRRAKDASPLDLVVTLRSEAEADMLLVTFIFNGPYFASWAVATTTNRSDPFFSQDCRSGGTGRIPALYPQSWRGQPLYRCLLDCLEVIRTANLTDYPWLRMLFLADIECWPEQPSDTNDLMLSRHTRRRQVDFYVYRATLQRQFSAVA